MAEYGTKRKSFALRVPVDLWESLEILRRMDCRANGEVSMNTWIETLLADKVFQRRDDLRLRELKEQKPNRQVNGKTLTQ